MNLFSLFNKRNYKYFYYKIKRYPKSVSKKAIGFKEITTIDDLINYFEIQQYKSIAVIASGPTSKNISLEKDVLYITTNDAIKIVSNANFIYIVNDTFYLTRYLKTFKADSFWRGTIFFIENIPSNIFLFSKIKKYLATKSRTKKEFLISSIKDNEYKNNIFDEFDRILKEKLGFSYEAINSGFMCVQIAFVFSTITKKPLYIYGLDMGVGGDVYFNAKSELGKSIKSDINRSKVEKVLNAMYKTQIKIINKSNFMRNEL